MDGTSARDACDEVLEERGGAVIPDRAFLETALIGLLADGYVSLGDPGSGRRPDCTARRDDGTRSFAGEEPSDASERQLTCRRRPTGRKDRDAPGGRQNATASRRRAPWERPPGVGAIGW